MFQKTKSLKRKQETQETADGPATKRATDSTAENKVNQVFFFSFSVIHSDFSGKANPLDIKSKFY